MTTEAPTVAEALSKVMADVQAVRKTDRNQQQNFSFRGIDAVVNAVGPALRRHGVIVVPTVVAAQSEQYQTRSQTQMRNTVLTISWRFYGPRGDFIDAQTMGEAADAGDKSVSKAHSVAYRTLLLQALCIPTDEPDPDASAHERAVATVAAADPRLAAQVEIRRIGEQKGLSVAAIKDDFASWSQGEVITEADLDLLNRYAQHLREGGAA